MSIGEQIRKYRKEAGISQEELGRRLGISQQQIAQYENGKRIPKIETINNIAGALGIGVKRLYPEFSREEWKKTETYKKSVNRYDTAIRGIAAILSYKYDGIEEEIFEGTSFYTITKDGKTEDIKKSTLRTMLNCLIDMVPPIYELAQKVESIPTPIAAHNDHTEEPRELEKMQADAAMLNAARPRTDKKPTAADQQHDDDIMADGDY